MSESAVAIRIIKVIARYLDSIGGKHPGLPNASTKLHTDCGLKSDDGVNLVLDLCEEFQIDLPPDFNATVHDNGLRERTFGELTTIIEGVVSTKGSAA